jgi:DNA-binding PadR family transcriptional regulator
MYRDHSLLPKDGVRLAALGLLAQDGPMPYVRLANAVRQFTGYFWGPTLDVMSSSIELMRFEGLLTAAEGEDAMVAITAAGRERLIELLGAPLRAGATDFNKLIVALKVRYLALIPPEDRREQLETLIEVRESERARLLDLRSREATGGTTFLAWLDHEIGRIEADIAWFRRLLEDRSRQ